MIRWRVCAAGVVVLASSSVGLAYPTDEGSYQDTKIRRLVWQREVDEGKRRGYRKMPEGARWPAERIQLKMLERGRDYQLSAETAKDPELQAGLEAILKKWRWRRYNVGLLDITDPAAPRFAGVNETASQTPGSVAKLLVAAGLLQQLKNRFPDSIEKRKELLRETLVAADHWAMSDHHEVPKVTGDNLEKVSITRVRPGDTFSLWEWMDHALSPSSNASASTLWREATLMKLLGSEYPPAAWNAELYGRWDRDQWTEAAFATVNEPMIKSGLGTESFYLRMFFTSKANRYIHAKSSSATPLSLLQWMIKVEQGKLIDEWSSLELKKMLYITRKRVRYLYGRALNNCAAFFKSGSLFRCKPEPDFTCIQYQGNVINALNALIEIETPPPAPPPPPVGNQSADEQGVDAATEAAPKTSETEADKAARPPQHVYIIAVMSNELRRNAAMDHAKLAGEIHELVAGQKTCELPPTPTAGEQAPETRPPKAGKDRPAAP
jgi:hypothetical protein